MKASKRMRMRRSKLKAIEHASLGYLNKMVAEGLC